MNIMANDSTSRGIGSPDYFTHVSRPELHPAEFQRLYDQNSQRISDLVTTIKRTNEHELLVVLQRRYEPMSSHIGPPEDLVNHDARRTIYLGILNRNTRFVRKGETIIQGIEGISSLIRLNDNGELSSLPDRRIPIDCLDLVHMDSAPEIPENAKVYVPCNFPRLEVAVGDSARELVRPYVAGVDKIKLGNKLSRYVFREDSLF